MRCRVCATDRDDPGSPFCGVCGYNFATGTGGHVSPGPRITIEVRFDEARAGAPKGQPVRRFSLYDEESLLGRRSSSVAQTVGLDGDDAISRRHLLIVRQGGGYVARLFDNTNGGTHNGAEMAAGVEVPLAAGDELAIGSHTIIRVATAS